MVSISSGTVVVVVVVVVVVLIIIQGSLYGRYEFLNNSLLTILQHSLDLQDK